MYFADMVTALEALRNILRKRTNTAYQPLRMRQARKATIRSPRRSERVEALLSKWLDELTSPDTDPIEFLLRKMAEVVVDTSDE
jgi:hypothetical protein